MLSLNFFKIMLPKSIKQRVCLFILLFLVSLFIAGELLVAYSVSIWDRTRVENTISDSLHRQVHLGKINWRMGFRGLAFDTEEISVQNKDDTPFFHCGKATILFGIFPLLHGKLRIKHLDLQEPQAWAERLNKTEWNFSDFPQADVFSKFADCKITDGTLHLIDKRPKANVHYANTEIKHIQFQVHRPIGKYFWPFTLSAEIEQPEGLCKVALKGSGNGTLNEWRSCHYSFELAAQNLAPMRLVDFFDSIPETEGVVDINIKGSATPSSEFKGITSITTNRLGITPHKLASWKISNTSTRAEIICNKKQITWKGLSLKVGESELKSDGQLNDWLSVSPTYEAKVDSRIEELANILKNIEIDWVVQRLGSLPKDLALYGKIDLCGSTMTNSAKQQFTTQIILHDAQIKLNEKNVIASALNGSMKFDQDGLNIEQFKGSLSGGGIGTIDEGNFQLDGYISPAVNAPVNLNLSAHNLDLSNAKTFSQSVGPKNKLFTTWLVAGKIKDIKLHLFGTQQKPQITLYLVPEDLLYRPVDSSNPIHLSGGVIKYENDILSLENVNIVGNPTRFAVSAKILHCTTQPQIENIKVSNAVLDLKEISTCLLSAKNPDIMRQSFKKLLDSYGVSAVQGKLTGNLSGKNTNGTLNWDGDGALQAVQFKRARQSILLASGSFSTNPMHDMGLREINCSINKSVFTINGRLLNFNNFETLHPRIRINGQLYYEDIAPFFSAPISLLSSNKPISVKAFISDRSGATSIEFSAGLDGDTTASVAAGGITYNKPPGQPINMNGVITAQGPNLNIGTSQITIGQLPFQTAGTITDFMGDTPNIDMKAWIHDPIPIQTILSVARTAQSTDGLGDITGTLRGGMHILGPANALTMRAGCRILAAGLPKWNVKNINSHLRMAPVQVNGNKNVQNPVISLQLDTVNFDSLLIKDITGSISYISQEPQGVIKVENLKGSLAGGIFTASSEMELSPQYPFNIVIQINGLDANVLTQQFDGRKNELTGKVDMDLTLAGNANSSQALINTLSGSGHFHAVNGWIDKLSELQIKLEEANIIDSGVLGFRLSNLWSTSNPQENGEFLSTSGQFEINNGIVQLNNIVFDGEEMKLQAAGTLDLTNKRILLHASGDIPRVSTEGSLAKVTSFMSIAALTNFVSKATHIDATMPVIGGFSHNPIHPFAFTVDGSLNEPNTIGSSIAKSFHWLGNPPTAKLSSVQKPSAQSK